MPGDFTITKNQDQESLLSLVNESKEMNAEDYTSASYQKYEDAVAEAEAYLETDKDMVPAELTEKYDASIQGNNENDPLNYYGYARASTRIRIPRD